HLGRRRRRWWRHLALEHDLGQLRRQLGDLGAVVLGLGHQQEQQAQQRRDDQHAVADAPKARDVGRRVGPRQEGLAKRDRVGTRAHVSNPCRTANDTSVKLARALVTITLRSRRYGMSLSPMIVIAACSAWFFSRITWRLLSSSSSAFNSGITSASAFMTAATSATLRPSTTISVPLTDTTMVSLGCVSAIDSGSLTARELGNVSISVAEDSRKKIRIVKMSISETRFRSSCCLLR